MRKKPVAITPEIVEEILAALASGQTLTAACSKDPERLPRPEAFAMLAQRDPEFGAAYRYARRIGYELAGDQLRDKSAHVLSMPNPDMARVNAVKVSADIDKWVMERAHPELWGARTEVSHHLSGQVSVALPRKAGAGQVLDAQPTRGVLLYDPDEAGEDD